MNGKKGGGGGGEGVKCCYFFSIVYSCCFGIFFAIFLSTLQFSIVFFKSKYIYMYNNMHMQSSQDLFKAG